MNDSKYRISLDIQDISSQATLNVKKNDTARKIWFSFTEDGRPYKIATGCTAKFRAKKPDGTILFNNCTIRENIIEYALTQQTSATVGILECEVTLYGANGHQITSPRFTLIVEDIIASDSEIESKDEFTALTTAINETNNLDISATKDGAITEITIIKKDGTTQTVNVLDAEAVSTKQDKFAEVTTTVTTNNKKKVNLTAEGTDSFTVNLPATMNINANGDITLSLQTGNIILKSSMSTYPYINGVNTPVNPYQAANKQYVDNQAAKKQDVWARVTKQSSKITLVTSQPGDLEIDTSGTLILNGATSMQLIARNGVQLGRDGQPIKMYNLANPADDTDAANKQYVDEGIAENVGDINAVFGTLLEGSSAIPDSLAAKMTGKLYGDMITQLEGYINQKVSAKTGARYKTCILKRTEGGSIELEPNCIYGLISEDGTGCITLFDEAAGENIQITGKYLGVITGNYGDVSPEKVIGFGGALSGLGINRGTYTAISSDFTGSLSWGGAATTVEIKNEVTE